VSTPLHLSWLQRLLVDAEDPGIPWWIDSHAAIKRILDHLGLSPPENERPPPEIRYVPIDDEGRELVGSVAEAHAAP
jgi:hypothetical protein